MDIINAIIIGILQGIIEWLPISSQGGLMIYLSNILNISIEAAFNNSIFLHLGTVFAALFYFRKDIVSILSISSIKNIYFPKDENSKLLRFFVSGIFFTLLISGPIYFLIGNNISSLNLTLVNLFIGILLIITGVIMYFPKFVQLKKPKLSIKNSIILGLFQGFSILPGLSRSGLTTSALLFEGFPPEKAFKISFLISIPTILIGELGMLLFSSFVFEKTLLISLVVAFIVGYFTIGILIRFARKINFSYFCFILGFIYILLYVI
jgi:undecaprenyl-diphosphatase